MPWAREEGRFWGKTPIMPPPLQGFELQLFETFQTRDPAAPIVGTDIAATVGITIDWTLKGEELTDKCVRFGDPVWGGAGHGPLTVYRDVIGGSTRADATVSWSVETHVVKKVEHDGPNRRLRWAVTPVVQLIRKTVPKDGNLARAEVVYTASDTVRGAWMSKRDGHA